MKRTYSPLTVPLEDAEQRIIFQWAAMETAARPELGLLYAIPNGGKRAMKTAIALKAQGVKSGVPDMCLPVARGGYHGLYIELKRQKGGTVSETQKSWITALTEQGYNLSWRRGSNRADKGVFMSYINKDLKELIITLASVIGFGDVLVKTGRLHQEDEDAAKLMMGAATTISQHLLQGRDAEQIEALQRQAGFYEIIAVPKTSARIDKEFYICPREDFESLVIDDFSNPCPFCELEGKEVRKCGRRRALIRCGVVGNTEGDCPYKGI